MERRHVTLREALASDQLEAFVRQEEALGVELAKGSDFGRALALLITQRLTKKGHRPTPTPQWFSVWSVFGTLFDGALHDCTSCVMELGASLIS
ncbi:MAG: hypothetical protein WBQ20_01195 [Methyloceanibacter sp.]|jgi:hypothetical protein